GNDAMNVALAAKSISTALDSNHEWLGRTFFSVNFPLPNDDFADLYHRRDIGVIGYVAQDLVRMRSEASLKTLHRIAENMTHADIRCRAIRCTSRKTAVNRIVSAFVSHAGFHQRHVLVTIILVVEACSWCIRVHHGNFDHLFPFLSRYPRDPVMATAAIKPPLPLQNRNTYFFATASAFLRSSMAFMTSAFVCGAAETWTL